MIRRIPAAQRQKYGQSGNLFSPLKRDLLGRVICNQPPPPTGKTHYSYQAGDASGKKKNSLKGHQEEVDN